MTEIPRTAISKIRKTLGELEENNSVFVAGENFSERPPTNSLYLTGEKMAEFSDTHDDDLPPNEKINIFVAPSKPIDNLEEFQRFTTDLGSAIQQELVGGEDEGLYTHAPQGYKDSKSLAWRGNITTRETIAVQVVLQEVTTTTETKLETIMEPQVREEHGSSVEMEIRGRNISIEVFPNSEAARLAKEYDKGEIKNKELGNLFGKFRYTKGNGIPTIIRQRNPHLVDLSQQEK